MTSVNSDYALYFMPENLAEAVAQGEGHVGGLTGISKTRIRSINDYHSIKIKLI